MSWFKEIHGKEPDEFGELPPALDLKKFTEFSAKILEEHPRVVETKNGRRAVILVDVDGAKYTLWLSRIILARKFAVLEKASGSLLDKTVHIKAKGMAGRAVDYDVTLA